MAASDDDTLPALTRMLDGLYRDAKTVPRLQVLQTAEVFSLPEEVLALFELLPPRSYTRQQLVDQLNSAIVGHGMGRTLGTLE